MEDISPEKILGPSGLYSKNLFQKQTNKRTKQMETSTTQNEGEYPPYPTPNPQLTVTYVYISKVYKEGIFPRI